MRNTTQQGLALIAKYEGFSSTPYICPAGYLTIGYGHLIKPNESFTNLNKEQALCLLKQDVTLAEISVLKNIKIPLTNNQYDALVSFTFNLGGGALQRSTLRQLINREEHELATREFLKWIWVGGKKMPGLIRRRSEEAELYSEE